MASAYLSGRSWIADFRGFNTTKQRRVRIPLADVPGTDTPTHRAKAKAWAADCERCVRMLETAALGAVIDRAENLGAITEEQAASLRGSKMPVARLKPVARPLMTAAEMHPSSQREPLKQQLRHSKLMQDFLDFAKVTRAEELTLAVVQSWITHMKGLGWKWDTRRHALLWVRRAAAMGVAEGLPDPLAGFTLDSQGDESEDEDDGSYAWTMQQLAHAAWCLAPQRLEGDHRPRAALGLTGFMGLRGSEAARVPGRWLNVEASVLHIRKSKTKAGIRDLPVPQRVMAWLVPLTIGADPDQPLLRMDGRRKYNSLFFKPEWWGRWLGDHMARVTGRNLPAKCLRKSFATWTDEARLDPRWIESYLGHQSTHLTKVTLDHYRQRAAVDALRPAAAVISAHIDRAMAAAAFQVPLQPGSLHEFPTFDVSLNPARATG